jgi:putative transposase
VRCARKRIARLMPQAGLTGAQRRRYRGTTRQNPDAVAAPDLVQRDFTVSGPDQLWVADITYVSTGEGRLYLATVLDAWSRRVDIPAASSPNAPVGTDGSSACVS